MFNNKTAALKTLHKVAKPKAQLIIFDYYDLSNGTCPLINKISAETFVEPVSSEKLIQMLHETDWKLTKFIDLNENFCKWYEWLVEEIVTQKDLITNRFGGEAYFNVLKRYQDYLHEFRCNNLGGGVFYAVTGDKN